MGLLVASGPGIAVSAADDSGGSSSSSSSESASSDRGPSERERTRETNQDRSAANRERTRESSSESAKQSTSGAGRDRSADPSEGADDEPAGRDPGGVDGDDAPASGRSASSGGTRTSARASDDEEPAVESSTEGASAGGTQVNAAEPEPDPQPAADTPEPAVEPPAPVQVQPAAVTELPAQRSAGSAVDRSRLQMMRTVTVATPVLPVLPSSPSDPVAPVAVSYVSSLTMTRRDMELQQIYGEPAKSAAYWRRQTSGDCVLMSVAMIIGQLTGRTPTEAQIVFRAMRTPSVRMEYAGKMMYRGLKNVGKWAFYEDAAQLLNQHGLQTDLHWFPTFDANNADAALDKLKTALSDPDKAVMVAIHNYTIYNEVIPGVHGDIPENAPSNHAVVVTGYNPDTDTIILNDSAPWWPNPDTGRPYGQAMEVPREVFMAAWARSRYLSLAAERPEELVVPITKWLNLMPRRDAAAYDPARSVVPSQQSADQQHRIR
ncbi:C39 family peptidase [Mycolicibacterium sp.]|uniref:C39 family peptidase n=1 Tax=Mycolicibacterium sp. TaxID=2320850 RepID=UPI003D0E2E9C